jgi:hypothetical protein
VPITQQRIPCMGMLQHFHLPLLHTSHTRVWHGVSKISGCPLSEAGTGRGTAAQLFQYNPGALDGDGPMTNEDLITEICKCGDLCEITTTTS